MIVVAVLVLATAVCVERARHVRSPRISGAMAAPGARRTVGPGWLVDGLARADVPVGVDLVVRGWVAVVVVGGSLGAVVGGLALAVLVAVGAVLAGPVGLHLARDRADRRLEAALPDALDALARSLRTGASLRQAIGEVSASTVGHLGDDLRAVARELDAGIGLVGALDGWRARRPLPGVRLAATALALGAGTGGASARAVDGLAQTLRTNAAIGGEVRALSSQARMSALVIAVAPLGFTALAVSADPRTGHFLFRTTGGLACLVLGIGLDAVGALWMRHLSVVRA